MLAFLASLYSGGAAADESACVTLSGRNGQAQGTLCGAPLPGGKGVVYKGIRYASAERWTSSRVVTDYGDAPQAATAFGPICPQAGGPGTMAEDCLYLNVWTPVAGNAARADLPVLVFIHGGAFVEGAGSQPYYDGTAFARDHGIVVVTLNYRLGALGFLRTDAKGRPPRNGGNFGIEDQLNALVWVRDNIGAFGGDPARVTLVGESAGAMSTGLHLLSSPRSQRLFRAAIQESNPLGYRYRNRQQAREQFTAFVACLNSVMQNAAAKDCSAGGSRFPLVTPTTGQILLAQNLFSVAEYDIQEIDFGLPASIPFAPSVDGRFLTRQPADAVARGAPKPALYGFNKDEGVIFAEGEGALTSHDFKENMAWLFGRDAVRILREPRYDPDTLNPAYGLPSAALTAYANFFADFEVKCATMAANRRPSPKASRDIWMYEFTQTAGTRFYQPAYDPLGLCAAHNRWGNSCHGNELQYVFDTLDDAATGQDRALAIVMNDAWAEFVKAPGGGPGIDGWGRWQWHSDRPAAAPYELADPRGNVDTGKTFAASNCAMWLKKSTASAAARSHGRK
jgi:carboxylesterase type B